MSVTSCIPRIENDRLIIIRESYKAICKGNECSAALLNFYEYRHNTKLSELEEKIKNNPKYKPSENDFLIQASNKYLQEALLDSYGRNSIISANSQLQELGFIDIVTDVYNPNGGLPINHVLLNVDEFIDSLMNYSDEKQRLKKDDATFKIKRSQRLKKDDATFKKGYNKDNLKEKVKDNNKSLASPFVEAPEKENHLIDLQTKSEQDTPLRPATSFENQTKPIEPKEVTKAKATEKAIKETKAGDRSKHLHQPMVDFYNNFYFLKTGEAFSWSGRHLKAIKEIRVALEKMTIEKWGIGANDENYMNSFRFFFEEAWNKGDNFLRKNFTPSYIFGKFNEIIILLKAKEVNNAASNNRTNNYSVKYTSRIDEFIASVHH